MFINKSLVIKYNKRLRKILKNLRLSLSNKKIDNKIITQSICLKSQKLIKFVISYGE